MVAAPAPPSPGTPSLAWGALSHPSSCDPWTPIVLPSTSGGHPTPLGVLCAVWPQGQSPRVPCAPRGQKPVSPPRPWGSFGPLLDLCVTPLWGSLELLEDRPLCHPTLKSLCSCPPRMALAQAWGPPLFRAGLGGPPCSPRGGVGGLAAPSSWGRGQQGWGQHPVWGRLCPAVPFLPPKARAGCHGEWEGYTPL